MLNRVCKRSTSLSSFTVSTRLGCQNESNARASLQLRGVLGFTTSGKKTFKYQSRRNITTIVNPQRQANSEEVTEESTRNEVGVQLLSRHIHSQIFKNASFPPPDPAFVQISRDHLAAHNLDPSRGSHLPDISFDLPPLQGRTIDEHFYRIGADIAEPYLGLAKTFSADTPSLPPKPENWAHQPGWTKYYPDGSFEHVDNPGEEQMLCFDIETMPKYHQFAIMACAASPTAWYAWISPWLLGLSSDPNHQIPLGDPSLPRIVVGHRVSYDRSRVLEEYDIERTSNRFIDTMALHVAIRGISSHQRPAWMARRKEKAQADDRKVESVEAVKAIVRNTEEIISSKEVDEGKKGDLARWKKDLEDGMPQLLVDDEAEESEAGLKRWEDITSANSLADVARLHCGIELDKEIRDDFMTATPEVILADLDTYLQYCAEDVDATHAVFCKVLPAFLQACPSPVSFAGVINMGNSFLPVDETWLDYLRNAEGKFKELEAGIKDKLIGLAEEVKKMMRKDGEKTPWEKDVWLQQLDWTPKVPGPSRGVAKLTAKEKRMLQGTRPKWYHDLLRVNDIFSGKSAMFTLPLLLQLSYEGFPIFHSSNQGWMYRVPLDHLQASSNDHPSPMPDDLAHLPPSLTDSSRFAFLPLPTSAAGQKAAPLRRLLARKYGLPWLDSKKLKTGNQYIDLAKRICSQDKAVLNKSHVTFKEVMELAEKISKQTTFSESQEPWFLQLDWSPVPIANSSSSAEAEKAIAEPITWPKWYWDLTAPKKGKPPGTVDVTIRNRTAPLLLRLSWQGWPLFHSRQSGWTFRVPSKSLNSFKTRERPISFETDGADAALAKDQQNGFVFYKLPHEQGVLANVGSPFSKTFVKYAQDGTLTSPGNEARAALDMNAQCSYWISVRDRVLNQLVVWEGEGANFRNAQRNEGKKLGMILPQVITMGTITRRAIEKTWLTASNAKKNRVGSELKSMVRAPVGYCIVGADVDSEELWISSVMGDAQFGVHGATAIGWMTLEGTKAAGTDLHSKTASILGLSRDQAKVFNYSRIYGAGKKHAIQLLLQANSRMLPEEAKKLAQELYASTKGKSTHHSNYFDRKFWYGGTESFLFNKLEQIALSDLPQTPALGCGITSGLAKEYLPTTFGSDFMPSRINWVVQSSGVDYLHLLIVAMEYLIRKYRINARYLISVHDEVRYLVKEDDKYRTALALQVANLWTRSLFAFRLGMDDLPQGVAFFSAVDIDHVLRKEVFMECVTPSQPVPIPPGESIDIAQVLEKTAGTLNADGQPMQSHEGSILSLADDYGYVPPDSISHRAKNPEFLQAQATTEVEEIKMLAKPTSHKKSPPSLREKKMPSTEKREKKTFVQNKPRTTKPWNRVENVEEMVGWDVSVENEVKASM